MIQLKGCCRHEQCCVEIKIVADGAFETRIRLLWVVDCSSEEYTGHAAKYLAE